MFPIVNSPWKSSRSFSALLRGMIFIAFLVQPASLTVAQAPESFLQQSGNTSLQAQASQALFLVNVIDTSAWNPPSPDPVGIDYHPGIDRLIVADSEVDEMGIFQGVNVFEVTTSGQLLAKCSTLSFADEPAGIAINPANGHVFISQDDRGRIYEVDPSRKGDKCSYDNVVNTIDTRIFNSYDTEGLAFGEGKLFIANGEDDGGTEIYVLSPGTNDLFDGISPTGNDQVTHFDASSLGLRDPEGIGFHPERGTLFIVSRRDKVVVETTPDGILLNTFDLSFTDIQKPSGVGIGPSSLNPEKYSIYITDRGVDNGVNPNENDGKIYELGFLEKTYLPLMFK